MAQRKRLNGQKVAKTSPKPPEGPTVGLSSNALPSTGNVPQSPFGGSGTSLELCENFKRFGVQISTSFDVLLLICFFNRPDKVTSEDS
jgi:hypothetical protein